MELELWPEEVSTLDRTGNSCAHRQKCTSFSSLSDQTCFSSPKIKLTRTCHLVENNFGDAIRLQALLSCEIQLNFSSYPNYSWMQVAVKPTGKFCFRNQRAEAQAAWSIPTCRACVISWRAGSELQLKQHMLTENHSGTSSKPQDPYGCTHCTNTSMTGLGFKSINYLLIWYKCTIIYLLFPG